MPSFEVMQKIKVGIIGVGNISHIHIESYLKNPNVELYAFCDINKDTLEKMGQKYGIIRLYTDRAEMLALPELDAVSVCTWNSAHAPCTIDALNAGKHVLCEKPMATNVEDAIAMKNAAEKNGKLLMIGFVRRFGADMQLIRDFRDNGFFGDIYYAKATYLRRNGNPGGWFGDKARSGGGPLIDLGVHVIDFVRYALGNPKAVSVYGATYQKLFDRKQIKGAKAYVSNSKSDADVCDVEDLATAMIRFANGATLTVETSFSLNIDADESIIKLFGEKAGASVQNDVKISTETNGYLTDISVAGETGLNFKKIFGAEIDHFADCIINGTPCQNPAEDGVEMMKILMAIYRSAQTHHEEVIS